MATEQQHVPNLAKMAENKILAELKASIATHARSATYACGGAVPFKDTVLGENSGKNTEGADSNNPTFPAAIPPLDIRFGESGHGITATLPSKSSSDELQVLISACQPATFGLAGEDVFDEGYRKAGTLNASAFATNFCPYAAGIVDVVAQLLVPQTVRGNHVSSIKAELYALNVYSAPSGKFKAHVDTPRSTDQVGSLVVLLPVNFEGGQLAVRHAGQETVFDWSASQVSSSDSSIHWAAFYSDCEHEVYEVISGHRVTLTYNLYATRGLGHLAGLAPALDPTQLPLYASLNGALGVPSFLRNGRVLAMWLTHSYAHTNKHVNFLPSSLKGADMSLYETARALGLACSVVPAIKLEPGWHGNGERHLAHDKFFGFNEGYGPAVLEQERGAMLDLEDDEADYNSWGYWMPQGKITWLNDDLPAKETVEAGRKSRHDTREDQLHEAQGAVLAYGNQAEIDIHYSRAAMLIRVPPYSKRVSGEGPLSSIWSGVQNDYEGVDIEEGEMEHDEDAW